MSNKKRQKEGELKLKMEEGKRKQPHNITLGVVPFRPKRSLRRRRSHRHVQVQAGR